MDAPSCREMLEDAEYATVNRWVAGSNPARGAKFPKDLAKHPVALQASRATPGATFCRFREGTAMSPGGLGLDVLRLIYVRLTRLPLRPGDDAAILAKLNAILG